jgi:flagellar biosynthesis protein FlhA
LMAMTNDPAGVTLPGENVLEPAFGLPAKWIPESERDRAEFAGYTVVEPATVVATHLGELLASHAHEILGRRELGELLELAQRDNGKLIEELVPQQISHVALLKVLRGLLKERLSIRDFRGVLEAIAEHVHETKDPDQLVEHVRLRLGRQITARHRGTDGSVYAILLAPEVEGSFRRMQQPQSGFDPAELSAIGSAFEHATKNVKKSEELPVILVAGDIRRSVATFAARHTPGLSVVSYREVDPNAAIRTLAIVGANRAADAKGLKHNAAQNVHRA